MNPLPRLAILLVAVGLTVVAAAAARAEPPRKSLPLDGEVFEVSGRIAFLIPAKADPPASAKPWVWYAPTLPNLPGPEERWMFEKFRAAGVAVAGIDAGESYGSPAGNKVFDTLYAAMTARGFSTKPVLLGRSRGGLMTLSWAAANPEKVGGFAGIYPVCDLASYPGIERAAGAFEMKADELKAKLRQFNPVDRLEGLAKAKVPLFAIHGDVDKVVPLEANSGRVKVRYAAVGGSMTLIVQPQQGHNMWSGFFQCRELVEFVVAHAGVGSARAPKVPYDVFPPAEAPYYRVRFAASDKPGELIYGVNYTIWIPPGVKALRGVIVHQHGCGEGSCKSGLTGAYDLHWQTLAKTHDCALLSPAYEQPGKADCQMWCDPRNGSDAAFQKCLADRGAKSGHPELATAPWALWGHSGGGHWAGGMVMLHPQRIAAAWLRSGVPLLNDDPNRKGIKAHKLSDAALKVPLMCNLGTKEGVTVKDKNFAGVWPANEMFFDEVRGKGGLVGVAVDPLSSHDCGNQRYLAIPWLDACLSARLPKTAGDPLAAMPADRAWLAPPTGSEATPAAAYAGEPLKAAWLPNAATAKAWTEYVRDTKVSDTTPPPAPTDVRVRGNTLTWTAEADPESGLASFVIERDGQVLATVPETGKNPFGRPVFQNLQYSDTPTQPLVPMQFTDTKAEAGKKCTYRVIAVNTAGLKSKPSADAMVAGVPPANEADSLAGKRVVFLGDSNTQAGGYVSFTTYYLEKLYPQKDFDIIGLGLASETLSGLSEDGHAGGQFPRPCLFERLDRVLEKASPEVVFACYGMNDGIYLPLEKERFAAFQKGVIRLVDRCQKTGAKQIFLVTPPIYDFAPRKDEFNYDAVLTEYSKWQSKLKVPGVTVIDLHTAMQKARDARTAPFSGDKVHFGEDGHLLVARTILTALGAKVPDESVATIKANPLFKLVEEKRTMRSAAWMKHTGYTREKTVKPEPLGTAEADAAKMQEKIDAIRRKP